MKRSLSITLIFALVIILGQSCGQQKKKKDENTTPTGEINKVVVETVKKAEVRDEVTFTATAEPNMSNNITPNMPTRIRKIWVEVGENVKKGQLLVQMDAANLEQQKIQIETLKKDYERYKELYEVGGVSKQKLEQLKSQLEVSETLLKTLVENTKLISPINGVVTARNFDAGDIAGSMPILTIENMNPVKLKINISESYYTRIHKGMTAKVTVDALKDKKFQGKISMIYPKIDPTTHTFDIEINVPNPNIELLSGMFARVTLQLDTYQRAVVKDLAVQKQIGSNQKYVFVVKDGKARYTIVELGTRIDDKYEIISGLEEGEQVVVKGNTNLLDGMKVNVVTDEIK